MTKGDIRQERLYCGVSLLDDGNYHTPASHQNCRSSWEMTLCRLELQKTETPSQWTTDSQQMLNFCDSSSLQQFHPADHFRCFPHPSNINRLLMRMIHQSTIFCRSVIDFDNHLFISIIVLFIVHFRCHITL